MPIFWECDRCTACCRWPGQVRLTDADVTRIAAYLQLTEAEFIQGHTRINAQRNGLALLDQALYLIKCRFSLSGNSHQTKHYCY